jgi:hypothetical protein
MNSWIVRGTALAGVLVAVRLTLDLTMDQWPAQQAMLRYTGLTCVIAAAAAWGFVDGRSSRLRNPDHPERGPDLTMIWLAAGAFAGVVAGAVASLGLGDNSLLFELTSGAAWSMLLVFIAAMLGRVVGAFAADRRAHATTP